MGNMYCIVIFYIKENIVRVEMVFGRGEVLVFNVKNGKVIELKIDGDIFKKVF